MRGFLGTIAILLVILAVVGYYRHWFTVDVNQNQVQQDEKVLKDDAQRLTDKLNDKLNKIGDKTKDAVTK